jgi:hypothetical protein
MVSDNPLTLSPRNPKNDSKKNLAPYLIIVMRKLPTASRTGEERAVGGTEVCQK